VRRSARHADRAVYLSHLGITSMGGKLRAHKEERRSRAHREKVNTRKGFREVKRAVRAPRPRTNALANLARENSSKLQLRRHKKKLGQHVAARKGR
jgi:hypothetical protein